MPRTNINDLLAFLAVAQERSFTRAAAKLGVSQSTLSHTVRGLEERLGLRLLSRTTRSVAPTAAGERLLRTLAPRLDEIDAELAALSELRDRPAGTIRITTGQHAAETILWPALARLLPQYPEIKVDLSIEHGLTDIVTERYDAGVRLGEQVAKDMIAVRIGPDFSMAVVGAPSYFASRPKPLKPQDLTSHECINLHLPTYGGLYAWEFEKNGRELKVRVEGQLVFNVVGLNLNAALGGLASHTYRRISCRRTSPTEISSACSAIGALSSRATTSIIRADASTPPPSPCWSTRCATGACRKKLDPSDAASGDTTDAFIRISRAPGLSRKRREGNQGVSTGSFTARQLQATATLRLRDARPSVGENKLPMHLQEDEHPMNGHRAAHPVPARCEIASRRN